MCPPCPITAVIFDMDGVLADTERLHAAVEETILNAAGVTITAVEISRRYGGLADRDFFSAAFGDAGVEADIAAAIAEKWRRMSAIAPADIRPMPGALDLVSRLGADGMRLALASSSPRAFIDRVLDALALDTTFTAVASGDEVRQSKPAPEIFLLAASRLGVAPVACLVLEDSATGLRAAGAAGMRSVALCTTGVPLAGDADLVIRDLSELTRDRIRALEQLQWHPRC